MLKKQEITVEILEIKESFSTELTDNLTTMNLAEMIKEAQYIVNFNLSEQFSFQFANTQKFLANRGSKIKDYAIKERNNHLIFQRGIESQKIMNVQGAVKLDSTDQNNYSNQSQIIIKESNVKSQTSVIENIKQPQQNNQFYDQSNSNKNGVQIGGGSVTYSQHLQQFQGSSQQIVNDTQQQSQLINQSSLNNVRQIYDNNSNFNQNNLNKNGLQIGGGDVTYSQHYQVQGPSQQIINNTKSQDYIRQLDDQNPVFKTCSQQSQFITQSQSENQNPVFYTIPSEQSYGNNQNQSQNELNARVYSQAKNVPSNSSSKIQKIQEIKKIKISCEESKYIDLLKYLKTNGIQYYEE